METLTRKQRLLSRNGVSYVALWQWRKLIKPYQIGGLRALKNHIGVLNIDAVAAEMADAFRKV